MSFFVLYEGKGTRKVVEVNQPFFFFAFFLFPAGGLAARAVFAFVVIFFFEFYASRIANV